MSYNQEREHFRNFKQNVTPEARQEYLQAIEVLLERYNTTIYENRFIVGGAVEVFTLMLLRSTGIPAVQGYDAETAAGDLILPNNRRLSVKGSFTGEKDAIRLVNTMGDAETSWNTATLFVLSGVGIVYGDPDMLAPGDLTRSRDALLLGRNTVDRFARDSDNLISMNIAQKPSTQMARFSYKASTAVARQIMFEQQLEILLAQVNGQ